MEKKAVKLSEMEETILKNVKNQMDDLRKRKQQPKELSEMLEDKLAFYKRMQKRHQDEAKRVMKPGMDELSLKSIELRHSVYVEEVKALESLIKKV